MVTRIRKAVERLKKFPGLGTLVHEWDRPDLREVVVGSDRVVYHLDERQILILAVIHGSRQL
jgi:plasmid stabilization system protein ParE